MIPKHGFSDYAEIFIPIQWKIKAKKIIPFKMYIFISENAVVLKAISAKMVNIVNRPALI